MKLTKGLFKKPIEHKEESWQYTNKCDFYGVDDSLYEDLRETSKVKSKGM